MKNRICQLWILWVTLFVGDLIKQEQELISVTADVLIHDRNINTLIQHEVVEINRNSKSVKVKNLYDGILFEDTYDSLLIATGSTPMLPPFLPC